MTQRASTGTQDLAVGVGVSIGAALGMIVGLLLRWCGSRGGPGPWGRGRRRGRHHLGSGHVVAPRGRHVEATPTSPA